MSEEETLAEASDRIKKETDAFVKNGGEVKKLPVRTIQDIKDNDEFKRGYQNDLGFKLP